MREHPTPEPGDRDQRPFSNSTEAEIWTASVCGGLCIHDTSYGADDEYGDERYCPLISLSMMGVWPHEWARDPVTWDDKHGGTHVYHRPGDCSEFADEFPVSTEPPVIAVDLFGIYNAEPRAS